MEQGVGDQNTQVTDVVIQEFLASLQGFVTGAESHVSPEKLKVVYDKLTEASDNMFARLLVSKNLEILLQLMICSRGKNRERAARSLLHHEDVNNEMLRQVIVFSDEHSIYFAASTKLLKRLREDEHPDVQLLFFFIRNTKEEVRAFGREAAKIALEKCELGKGDLRDIAYRFSDVEINGAVDLRISVVGISN